MGLLSNTTYVHMELLSSIDGVQRLLYRLKRSSEEDRPELLSALSTVTKNIENRLTSYLRQEAQELYPRVERIIARDLEEIRELQSSGELLLGTLRSFAEEIRNLQEHPPTHQVVRVTYLEMIFEEFVARYDERRELEMIFYRTLSTLLYPGGLSAD